VGGGEGPEMKHLATAGARYVTAGTGRERKRSLEQVGSHVRLTAVPQVSCGRPKLARGVRRLQTKNEVIIEGRFLSDFFSSSV
jgi:hypothetical protein